MAAAFAALCVCVPSVTAGQTSDPASPPRDTDRERRPFSVHVAAGTTPSGDATVVSGAAGYAPAPWLEVLVNVERLHEPARTMRYPNGYSLSRGGTMTIVSGEVRVAPLPRARVSPYAMAGIGRGVSHPTVDANFPDPVTNDLGLVYLGGGARVPLRGGIGLLGDARAMIAVEGADSVVGVWTVRGGVEWRF
jgi:hypothetical protein